MKEKQIKFMKKFLKKTKEHLFLLFDNIILLTGIGLFICGLFSFNKGRYCGEGDLKTYGLPEPEILGRFKCVDPAVFYFYDSSSLNALVIGAIFIVIGLLKLRKHEIKK